MRVAASNIGQHFPRQTKESPGEESLIRRVCQLPFTALSCAGVSHPPSCADILRPQDVASLDLPFCGRLDLVFVKVRNTHTMRSKMISQHAVTVPMHHGMERIMLFKRAVCCKIVYRIDALHLVNRRGCISKQEFFV